MQKAIFLAAVSLVFGSFVATAHTGEKGGGHATSHWAYEGATGPEHWGSLDPKFAPCSQGVNQSPIDLKNFIEADLPPIEFAYNSEATEILNNGHTIQVNFPPGAAAILIDGTTFELKQFHFHSPSENLIDSKSYPMEIHYVHADASGNLAVVALMMEEGEPNLALEGIWRELPKKADGPHALHAKIFPQAMLPVNRDYYRFNGSLTTPPCSEGVRWLVLKQPVFISAEQVKAFTHIMGHANNRPVQPVRARPVLR